MFTNIVHAQNSQNGGGGIVSKAASPVNPATFSSKRPLVEPFERSLVANSSLFGGNQKRAKQQVSGKTENRRSDLSNSTQISIPPLPISMQNNSMDFAACAAAAALAANTAPINLIQQQLLHQLQINQRHLLLQQQQPNSHTSSNSIQSQASNNSITSSVSTTVNSSPVNAFGKYQNFRHFFQKLAKNRQ